MQFKNAKMMLGGAVLFSVINVWWIYIYRLTGIKYDFAFDPFVFLDVIKTSAMTMVPLLLVMGFLMAVSIFVVRFFSRYVSKEEAMIMIAIGTLIPIAIGSMFFTNWVIFLVIMLFFMVGCLFFIKEPEKNSLFSKLGGGYNSSKNIVNAMAVGALIISFLFVATNLTESQTKFKDAVIKFQEKISIGSFLSKDEFRQMFMTSAGSQLKTRDQFRDEIVNQTANANGVTPEFILSSPNIMVSIDGNATYYYNLQMTQVEKQVDSAYAGMLNGSSLTRPLTEKMFSAPPLSYIFDFIPLVIPVMLASFVSLFGMIWVGPMGGLLGAFLPNPPQQPQPPKPPETK